MHVHINIYNFLWNIIPFSILYFTVVHYSLSFLVSWAYSCDEVKQALCTSSNFVNWLKRLTLQAPEVSQVTISQHVYTNLHSQPDYDWFESHEF